MASDEGVGGDEHADGNPQTDDVGYDHRELVSVLSGSDLPLAHDLLPADGESAYGFDPAVDPERAFPQGIASGGPTPSGVILWTRVAPDVYDPDEPVAVVVAHDEDMEETAYRGIIADSEAIRAHDHTVKVDLDGELDPDATYHYRFVHDGVASRVGRCRTLPAPDASPERVSFAVLTCQNYQNGYYGAYHHVAEEDVDFLVHVGDFIYESATDHFTGLGSPDLPDRQLSLPSGNDRAHTLEDYRYLYRTYKSDRFLREALRRHTLIPAWDDHEIANDIYWDPEADAPRAEHPLDGESVHWNYERHSDYVVLSRRPLEAPEYVDVGRYKVYDGGENRQRRVRPHRRIANPPDTPPASE